MDNTYHFGKKLAELRKKQGFSQQELANITGLSQRVIAYYENEKRIDFLDKLEKITKALNISTEELLQIKSKNSLSNKNDIFSNLDTRTIKKIKELLRLSRQERSIVYKFIDSLSTKNPKKPKHPVESKN